MKKLLLFCITLFCLAANAQTDYITVLPSTGGTSNAGRAPLGGRNITRSVWIISASEMAASGLATGDVLNSLGFNFSIAQSIATTGNMLIYLQNTSDATNTKSATWSTAITGMTTVSNASVTLPAATGTFDIAFSGGTTFTYTGGALYLAFDYQNLTNPVSSNNTALCNTAMASSVRSVVSGAGSTTIPTTLGTASASRPETRLGKLVPCARPTSLSASNQTLTSADLTFSATSGGSVELEYGPINFVQGTGTTITNAVSPVTVSGLSSGTLYQFYVRKDCGGGTFSNWNVSPTFSTLFEATNPTYTTSFEQEKVAFVGWTTGNVPALANDWQVGVYGPGALVQDGNNAVYSVTPSGAAANNWLLSRGINLTAGTIATINYYVSNYKTAGTNTTSYQLTVGTSQTVAAQSTILATETGISAAAYTLKTYTFVPAATTTYYFGFRNNSPANATGTHAFFLDNFTVSSAPCPESPAFSVSPAAEVCSATAVTYTTASGQLNYAWTVPGVLNTDYTIVSGGIDATSATVTLQWLTAGSKTVTVNYTNCTGASAATNTTTVSAGATAAVLSGTTAICVSGSANLQVAITGGTPPFTVVYTDGTSNYTVNSYTSGAAISVSPTVTTTYSLVSVTGTGACAGGTGNSGTATVIISTNNIWTGANGTSWTNTGNWSCGSIPTGANDITIGSGGNQPVITADAVANSLTLESGATLTVAAGFDLTVTGAIANAGTLTIENNANLIQTNDVANTGAGSTIVKRNSAALMREDYTLWASPVSGQQLLAFSPLTLTTRFYTYNPLTDFYTVVASPAAINFATAKGYLIRMPNNHPTTATSWQGTFTGTANNGTQNLTVNSATFNAVGNPYPSTINANAFIAANSSAGALYFWRKTNGVGTSAYATYTAAGGVGTANSGDPLGLVPNGIIQVGQGFITKATATTLTFNNSMRTGNNANQFLKNATEDKSRIWLNLTQPTGAFSQTLLAYMPNASQGIDEAIDGHYINDSPTALTSIINNEEFSIQGRALPFVATDVVPLGFKTEVAGTFNIAIDRVDGLFSSGETVYLKDNSNNTVHNLSAASYDFATAIGVFNTRFEIVYQNTLAVSQPVFNQDAVVVYKQNQELVVNTGKVPMATVKVFDSSGRLLAEKNNINTTETRLFTGSTNQVVLVRISSQTEGTITKKVMN